MPLGSFGRVVFEGFLGGEMGVLGALRWGVEMVVEGYFGGLGEDRGAGGRMVRNHGPYQFGDEDTSSALGAILDGPEQRTLPVRGHGGANQAWREAARRWRRFIWWLGRGGARVGAVGVLGAGARGSLRGEAASREGGKS